MLSTCGLVYSQPEENQLDFIDIQGMNLTLGKPMYIERFIVPQYQDENVKLSSSEYSFSGNGTLNGMEISATGNGLIVPREDGTNSITGRALFNSNENGNASYSFQAITNIQNNITRHLGAAFFDANATGNLEFLKSTVGVYKAQVNEKGIFAMWQFK
jgi:hypothetical protein